MFINRSLTCVSNFCKQIQRVNVTPVGRRCSQLNTDNAQPESGKKVSKAMKAYLERSRAYNEFMQRESDEYNIGKRHLANMMGKDAETFTQQDIDEAIEYLLPSGLFEKKARPMMKPPHLIFPPKKDAEFDESGRPFHFLFYTGKPNFYNIMHEIVSHMNNLTNEENEILRGNKAGTKEKIELVGTKWLSKTELEQYTVESLTDNEYQNFVVALDRLCELSQAVLVKDFIMKLRSPLMDSVMKFEAEKPSYDMNGRAYIITRDCPRKDARADVTVYSPGTGKISINNQGIEYFSTIQARNQILYPLELTGLRTSVDIIATVRNGGETGQAGAIRWGISWGLKSFVSKDMIETMRLAGLLTRDFRRRERKKPGQAKARKKFTWKKR